MELFAIIKVIVCMAFVIFCFGFCIFIHEFGHLLAAIWRGLHIEKFSVGFGKAIWKRRWYNIDFLIGWIPFGGYVALPQLEPTDHPTASDGTPLPPIRPTDRGEISTTDCEVPASQSTRSPRLAVQWSASPTRTAVPAVDGPSRATERSVGRAEFGAS